MKAKELKEIIKTVDDDTEVILQKDSEGNGYSPLGGINTAGIYIPDTTYCGEVYSSEWSASDACMTEEKWTEFKKKKKSLILFPIN